jgi:hypothetical protein
MKFRKLFLGLFLVISVIVFASEFEENELDINCFLRTSKVVNDKVYIEPGMIYVAPSQILLNIKGQILPITHLSADESGVFVTIEEIVSAAKGNNETWKCRKCGRINSLEDRWCRTCKRDPNGNL